MAAAEAQYWLAMGAAVSASRVADEADGVILHVRSDGDLAHERHRTQQRLWLRTCPADCKPVVRLRPSEFVGTRWVADLELEHEAIDLRLGQRVGAFLLDGVLRRQNEERLLELERLVANGDLPFLHRFEQRALHLGRRAIDFVGEDEVGEDRPALNWNSRRPPCVSMTMFVPRMSAGIKSGVNWMRLNGSSSTSLSVRTSSVLPRPGTPSSNTCPPANSAINVPSTMASWPTIILPISARRAA